MTESQPTVDVVVGRIGRAHGIRGELTVEPRTDEPERRFAPGSMLREEGGQRRFTVAASRWHAGRLLVRFEEIADRTAAEARRGVLLVADVAPSEPLADENEFWDRDLIGLQVLTVHGDVVGVVLRVQHGPQDLLVVRNTAGQERLVPFVAALVPNVDLTAGTVTVTDMAGLLFDDDEEGVG